jgi:hypothetical protein
VGHEWSPYVEGKTGGVHSNVGIGNIPPVDAVWNSGWIGDSCGSVYVGWSLDIADDVPGLPADSLYDSRASVWLIEYKYKQEYARETDNGGDWRADGVHGTANARSSKGYH